MRWTPENDQTLLLKILETCNVVADSKLIAAAWPDGDEKPTARAITERIVKIRSTSKAKGGGGNFKVSNARVKDASSPAGTPKKRPAAAASKVKVTKPLSNKKRKQLDEDPCLTDDSEDETPKKVKVEDETEAKIPVDVDVKYNWLGSPKDMLKYAEASGLGDIDGELV